MYTQYIVFYCMCILFPDIHSGKAFRGNSKVLYPWLYSVRISSEEENTAIKDSRGIFPGFADQLRPFLAA